MTTTGSILPFTPRLMCASTVANGPNATDVQHRAASKASRDDGSMSWIRRAKRPDLRPPSVLMTDYRQGSRIIDVATLVDPLLLPSAVAAGVGIQDISQDLLAELTTFLKE
jgi:hypothetical protein